jgi:hypothetical protein
MAPEHGLVTGISVSVEIDAREAPSADVNLRGPGNNPSRRSRKARNSIGSGFSAGERRAAADSISTGFTIHASVHRRWASCEARGPIEDGRLCLGTWQGIYLGIGPLARKLERLRLRVLAVDEVVLARLRQQEASLIVILRPELVQAHDERAIAFGPCRRSCEPETGGGTKFLVTDTQHGTCWKNRMAGPVRRTWRSRSEFIRQERERHLEPAPGPRPGDTGGVAWCVSGRGSPLPPTHHADCCPTPPRALTQKRGRGQRGKQLNGEENEGWLQ